MFKKKEKPKKILRLIQYRPVFTTSDKVKHVGKTYNYADMDMFTIPVKDHLMREIIHEDGYIMDENNLCYLLHTIKTVEFEMVNVKKVIDNNIDKHKYQKFYTDEEVEEMEEYNE